MISSGMNRSVSVSMTSRSCFLKEGHFFTIWIEIRIGPPDEFINRRPIAVGNGLIDKSKATLTVFRKNKVGIGIDDLSDEGMGSPEFLLCASPFCDVGRRTDVACHLVLSILKWDSGPFRPADHTGAGDEPEFQFYGRQSRQVFSQPGLVEMLPIVRRKSVQPSTTVGLIRRVTGHVAPASIHIGTVTVEICHKDGDRRMVC